MQKPPVVRSDSLTVRVNPRPSPPATVQADTLTPKG